MEVRTWIHTLRMSHADLEVYACRIRTWSESKCEGRVLAPYIWLSADHVECVGGELTLHIWSNEDHVECRRLYMSGLGVGVDQHSTLS